ncbi:MAG: hypothetical protein WCE90_10660 [Candidatus Zixiibacteriota bacterium]
MSETNLFQIAYMPYAPIKEGFQIGNYEVWPFYKESNTKINNQKAIEKLTCLFRQYFERKFDKVKGGYDKPLDEVFIISPLNYEIGVNEFTETQIEEIRDVCHTISFCAINECAFVTSSADLFTLHRYSFQPGSDSFRLGITYFSNLEMIKFMKPNYLESSLLEFEKTDLCHSLGKALQFKDRNQIKRIFRTLELFYHTATHSEMMTDEHRLLSLVMCFEVLLNFNSKESFVSKIETMLENYRPILETKPVPRRNNKVEDLTYSKTGWWAYDLYNLRSNIVHGKDINWDFQKYGNVWTRIQFGGILIKKLVKKILSQESLWPPDDASDSDIIGDAIIEADRLDIKLENMVAEFNETYIGKDK